jgi:hypothetical protein
MDSDKTVTANFSEVTPVPGNYTLTMAVNDSNGGSTTPAVGNYEYPEGTKVEISASQNSGWQFVSWSGGVAEPNSASTNVTMDSDKTVTANFSEVPVYPAGGGGYYIPPTPTPTPTPTPVPPVVTPTPTPTPEVTPTPTPTSEVTPTPVVTPIPTETPTPTPTPTPAPGVPGVPWSLIGGLIGAAIAAGLLFFLLWRRRRGAEPDETV